MSRLGQWLRDDLSKVNKPREIVRTIRSYPMILVIAALNSVVAMLVIYAILALFGHVDAFSDWLFLAAIWAGGSGGRMISERKSKVASPPNEAPPSS